MSRERSVVDEAQRLLDRVHDDPADVERSASSLLSRAVDLEARQLALWARGRARHEAGRFGSAREDLDAAARLAADRADADSAARITAHRALTEHAMGDVDAASASIALAGESLTGTGAGHVHLQRAILEVHAGNLVTARRAFDKALDLLTSEGDERSVARCLASRGVAHIYLGDFADAIADLQRAVERALSTRQRLVAAGALHNLGYARGRLGDVSAALRLLSDSEALYRELDSPSRVVASLHLDRAEVLLRAGLAAEAADAAAAAVARFVEAGASVAASDALALLAEAQIAAGRSEAARAAAEAAAGRFAAEHRAAWAARAQYLALRCELLEIDRGDAPLCRDLFDRACGAAAALDDAGLLVDAVDAWAFAGHVGAALGLGEAARAPLARAARARVRGPLASRVRGWYAKALSEELDGRRRQALAAVRRGLRLVDDHREHLVAEELRAGAAGHGVDLAALGLQLALTAGRPAGVFRWVEETRAKALASAPAPRPPDPELARLLDDLRLAWAEAANVPGSASARSRVEVIEGRVRDHERRRAAGGPQGGQPTRATIGSLRERLGAASFISLVELDGRLWSVVVTSRECRLDDHGAVGPVAALVERMRFALARLAGPARAAAVAAATAALADDGRALFKALGLGRVPDGPLVICPSRSLHGAAWSAMPDLVGRPITVTPSASIWVSGGSWDARRAGACFVAGPGLRASAPEVRAAARFHAGACVLVGAEATVERTVAAFGTNRMVHIAAHGRFRFDSPLFSGVELVDGPLTLLDLSAVPLAPEHVVLPGCDLAASRVLPGDEPLGAVASLVRLGVRSVVAPIGPVSDDATAWVMTELHRRMAAGLAPAEALGAVVAQASEESDASLSSCAASFVVAGRG